METIQVEIFGQMYTLKGGSDAEHIRALASSVSGRMKEVQKSTGISDGYRVAILAALNLADELHRIRSQHDALQTTSSLSLSRLLEITGEGTGT